MQYRKDISGLRAVAVLLVLLFHGRLAMFPSGFIGVDIFFVISGYLITSIIQSQLLKGTFSLSDFYVRRLWRIQVALLAVVLVTLLVALAFYLPADLNAYLRSAINALGFISNRYFSHATTAYAATDSQVLPLLHTWSLAVEWQWYLILPLWLMLLHRFATPRQGRAIVAAVTVLMAAWAMVMVQRDGDSAYFYFTPRIFEFLVGASVGLFSLQRPPMRDGLPANVLGVLSLLAIVAIAMKAGVIGDYPNLYAIGASVASAGVIVAGGNGRSWVARALSWRVPEFLGEISYSLYLWHWPIFALVRYLDIAETTGVLLGCYALTLVLAYLSYRYIEEPYRKKHPGLFKSLLWLVFIPVLLVSGFYSVANRLHFMPSRFGAEVVRIDRTLDSYTPRQRHRCMQSSGPRMTDVSGCTFGSTQPSRTALMIGDSYSNQSWNFIDVMARDSGLAVTAVSTPSCLAFPHLAMEGWWKMTRRQYQVCVDHVQSDYQRIEAGHYNYVIVGENWLYYEPDDIVSAEGDSHSVAAGRARLEASVRQALDIIVKSGAIPVLIESPVTMPADYQTCFYHHLKWRQPAKADACPVLLQDDEQARWLNGLFARLKTDYPPLILIDPKDAQCTGGQCASNLDGMPIYRDVGHFTDYASYRLGQIYLERKGNPFQSGATAR
ncbi:acyltransferase family protein [Dyella mobilis]|uniref:Acyltransferase n=1 Tax=Dyella mobilis TaxID=1849582 RepID=A0ABS2KIU9_9GAMM|nr:acyltransferase family protein [Dyella mobilis]MBM7130970.1 acyltransferase [Dyella mobilis]GLQ97599.1 acyltransferase [Dyella mobilis]